MKYRPLGEVPAPGPVLHPCTGGGGYLSSASFLTATAINVLSLSHPPLGRATRSSTRLLLQTPFAFAFASAFALYFDSFCSLMHAEPRRISLKDKGA